MTEGEKRKRGEWHNLVPRTNSAFTLKIILVPSNPRALFVSLKYGPHDWPSQPQDEPRDKCCRMLSRSSWWRLKKKEKKKKKTARVLQGIYGDHNGEHVKTVYFVSGTDSPTFRYCCLPQSGLTCTLFAVVCKKIETLCARQDVHTRARWAITERTSGVTVQNSRGLEL